MTAKATFACDENSIPQMVEFIKSAFPKFSSGRVRVEVKDADSRSTDQNSLYWKWLSVMAETFTKKGHKATKDEMHELMRFKFLGTEDLMVGKTRIEGQLKSTTKLTKNEMSEYMTKIEAWAIGCGVILPMPEDNEYMVYREAA